MSGFGCCCSEHLFHPGSLRRRRRPLRGRCYGQLVVDKGPHRQHLGAAPGTKELSVRGLNSRRSWEHRADTRAAVFPPQRVQSALVYPPCNTAELQRLPLQRAPGGEGAQGRAAVISVGQFRPEKAHRLQLEAWAELKRLAQERRALAGVGDRPCELRRTPCSVCCGKL